MRVLFIGSILVALGIASASEAQVKVSGLSDFVVKNNSSEDYFNGGWKGTSNFHTLRTRLFFDAPIGENSGLFVQALFDQYYFSLYGAYARFGNLAGKYLNLNVGLIPLTVGSFGGRTYSDQNPLIGTPLLYNYHSSYSSSGPDTLHTIAQLLEEREDRPADGMPIIFDAYWNTGAELYGSAGKLDYSLGVLTGSVSHPTYEQYKNIPQFTTHLVYYFAPGFVLGTSAFYGPYLAEDLYSDSLPTGDKYSSYINGGIGYEFYGVYRYLEIRSESFYAYWQNPYLPTLKVTAGYLEAKYKLIPGWYVAGRYDFYQPARLSTPGGGLEHWDYPVNRFEVGIGYHVTRQALLKLVGQFNRVPEEPDMNFDLFALQISVRY